MHIKIESGVDGVKAISFVRGDLERYLASSHREGWVLAGPSREGACWDSCVVCTVDELWEALLKVADDKKWVPI